MKKTIFTLLILSIISIKCFSQRHLKGMSGAELGVGLTKYGLYGNADFIHFLNTKSYLKAGVLFEKATFNDVSLNSFNVQVSYNRNLFHIGNSLFIQASVGALFNTNAYSGAIIESTGKKAQYFNAGLAPGIEIEYYISNRLALVLNAKECFYLGKELNNKAIQVFYSGLGLRLMFQK